MSWHTLLAVHAIPASFLEGFYGRPVDSIFATREVALRAFLYRDDRQETFRRYPISWERRIEAASRSNWFGRQMTGILDASGYESLRFLSRQAHTHVETAVDPNGLPDESDCHWGQPFEYTVFPADASAVIADVDGLLAWCLDDLDRLADAMDGDLIGSDHEELAFAAQNVYYDPRPGEGTPHTEDGEGPGLIFCVLRSLSDLLRYSRVNRNVCVWVNEPEL
ncbi:hypothetical protein [Tahibacter amnicola]|uniref:Uncharacterized protein n=1 Tax=Tahibacter amnicola TaxID=2976241 RepID=A0ABY6B7N5_9GAMM|nr:hypothetical protein [Tahibacter amnicola]UXI65910.1 hypothetical protein N4264_14210 [Tahibacter amnicola]